MDEMAEADRPRPPCILFSDWHGRWTSESRSYDPSAIHPLISYFQVFQPANVICGGAGVLLLVDIAMNLPYLDHSDTKLTQAAKDVLGSPDALMEIFKRIESFFRRLEEYAEVPTIQTEASIKHVIVEIMVEVLGIFAILTKEIKQGKTSQSITHRTSSVADKNTVTYLKKYLNRLIGRADIEGALENLRRLTNEEFKTAVAQIWKVVHHIQSGVDVATKKIDELDKKFVEALAGTFITSTKIDELHRKIVEYRADTLVTSTKIDELHRKIVEYRAGTFGTSATHKCHPKPTLHTASRRGKESS